MWNVPDFKNPNVERSGLTKIANVSRKRNAERSALTINGQCICDVDVGEARHTQCTPTLAEQKGMRGGGHLAPRFTMARPISATRKT